MVNKYIFVLFSLTITLACNRHEKQSSLIRKLVGQTSDNNSVYLELNSDNLRDFTTDKTIYKGFKIIKEDQIIFMDSAISLEIDDSKINWVNYKNIDYLILVEWDPIDNSNHLIFQLTKDSVTLFDKAYAHTLADYDNDGKIEIGGFRYLEAYCVDCDSMFYKPYHLYELTESIKYGSSASKAFTTEINGIYFEDQGEHVIKIKPAPYNGEHP